MYNPVNPSSTFLKWGVWGNPLNSRHVIMMLLGPRFSEWIAPVQGNLYQRVEK